MAIRLLIAEDHEVVRQGLRTWFQGTDIEVVAEATTGVEAITSAIQCRPDVLLIDVRMPNMDGLDALEKLRCKAPDLPVVVISSYDNPTYVARSMALGASAFVAKGAPRHELIAAITRAARKEESPHTAAWKSMKRALNRNGKTQYDDWRLTKREREVLCHIALGLSNREIGRSLGISVWTVKEHVENILRKINAADRTQAAVWAVQRGLVS